MSLLRVSFGSFTDGTTLSGADLDTAFAAVSTVVNGNLRAENFSARAGFGLENRASKGNRLVVSDTLVFVNAIGGTTTPTVPLMTISSTAKSGSIPAVLKVTEVAAVMEALDADYTAADTAILQYRVHNGREKSWGSWSTSINDTGGQWVNATVRSTTSLAPTGYVIGDNDYDQLQFRFSIAANGASPANDIAINNMTVMVTFEALHLP